LVALCLLSSSSWAAAPLVAEGDGITFLRGTASPDPGWTALGFDDSGWETGTLGIGYGDDDDGTVLDDMRGTYGTVFGRAVFDLGEKGFVAADVENLELSVRFDDGFVVYLNGQEIDRQNVSAGDVTHQTMASASVGDAPATCSFDSEGTGCAWIYFPADNLVDGENVLAFSVHNTSLDSSDLTFIPTLVVSTTPPPSPPFLTEGAGLTFLRGTGAPPPGWAEAGFDDSGWETGIFGIGYGDNDDGTVLDDMRDTYAAVFGRASFDLSDHGINVQDVERLELSVRFDDGFVIYLNGVEVDRANMPDGEVTEQTLATETVGNAPGSCAVDDRAAGCAVVTIPLNLLTGGENVLAFSVHNVGLGSSDLSFIPRLTAYATNGGTEQLFVRGDTNADTRMNIADAVFVLTYLFTGGATPTCIDATDVNDDTSVNVGDAVFILQYLFAEGPAIKPPHPGCGTDTTADDLSCEAYAPCP
jgi:hypothetical protein